MDTDKVKGRDSGIQERDDALDLDNPEFRDVLNLVTYTNRSVFMTGKAGTGKSSFLRYITAHTKKKHVVLAPTGIAAVNAGGVTIHSFFRIPIKPLLPDDPDFSIRRLRQRMKYPQSLIKLIRELELIVIDEISMVRADVMDFIDKILRVYCGNMRQPFGGKQLLLVGDVFQLEPVATGDTKQILARIYPSLYFFSALVFRNIAVIPIELKKIYRQKEAEFVSILDRIRLDRATPDDFAALNRRVVRDDSADSEADGFTMTLCTQRSMVDAINDWHLERIVFPEIIYHGEVSGDFPESSMPAPLELKLKNEAQIVFIRNDINHRWVNGTVGKVIMASPDSLEVELEDGERVMVEPERWSNIRYEYNEDTREIKEIELGCFTQLPVRLAWALTIHKSQGLTFNKVRIDLGRGAFTAGQTYVALSRCRSLDGLTLCNPVHPRDVYIKREVVEFSRGFNDVASVEAALSDAAVDADIHEASKLWARKEYIAALKKFLGADAKANLTSDPLVRRLLVTKFCDLLSGENTIAGLERQLREKDLKLLGIARDFVTLGNECLEGGDVSGAIEHFRKAVDIYPELPEAMRGLAKAYEADGRTSECIDVLKKLVCHPICEAGDFVMLAEFSASEGDVAEMLDSLLKGKMLFPESQEILLMLIEIYEEIGDSSEVKSLKAELRKLKSNRRKKK